jgi:hypothetical protein
MLAQIVQQEKTNVWISSASISKQTKTKSLINTSQKN